VGRGRGGGGVLGSPPTLIVRVTAKETSLLTNQEASNPRFDNLNTQNVPTSPFPNKFPPNWTVFAVLNVQ